MTADLNTAGSGGSDPHDRVRLLRRVIFFRDLDERQIAALANRARRRHLPAGQAIFHEGDPGHTLYVVASGSVSIERVDQNGRTVHVADRGPGDFFGDLALLDGKPRMADAVTTTDCDLLMLDREPFLACLDANPRMALPMLAVLAERLREAGDDLTSRQELDVRGRVADALLDLAQAHGRTLPDGSVRIEVATTHQQLAGRIGAIRESVTRALADLRRVKAIRSEGRLFVLTDLARLRRLAGR